MSITTQNGIVIPNGFLVGADSSFRNLVIMDSTMRRIKIRFNDQEKKAYVFIEINDTEAFEAPFGFSASEEDMVQITLAITSLSLDILKVIKLLSFAEELLEQFQSNLTVKEYFINNGLGIDGSVRTLQ